MKKVEMLKKLGEKMAVTSINPLCTPLFGYQPKPPAKIQKQMLQNK